MRDHTKYIFQGQRLGKAPLVRALVNQYVRDNPSIGFDQLRAAFPDKLQSDNARTQFARVRCVVMRRQDVPPEAMGRFSKKQLLLGQEIVAISHEWNIGNIQNVLAKAKELGYEVNPA